jgi:hypothetical protein
MAERTIRMVKIGEQWGESIGLRKFGMGNNKEKVI